MDTFLAQLSIWMVKFPAYLPFIMVIGIMTFILYKAHEESNQKFTIYDLVEDPLTGKGSLEKIGMLTGQLSITWWFIDMAAQNKVTVEEVMVYGGMLGVSKFAGQWLNLKYGKQDNTVADDSK